MMITAARMIREGEQVVTLLKPKDKIAEKVKDQDRFFVHFQQLFKGTVSRDFSSPVFFHQTTSPGPNGHAQKRFRIFPNIRGVICICN
jgi:hypothetical protein